MCGLNSEVPGGGKYFVLCFTWAKPRQESFMVEQTGNLITDLTRGRDPDFQF